MALNEQSALADEVDASRGIAPQAPPPAMRKREVMYRHTVAVRLTHWINALILVLLLISGLRLFNYHPALYWGNYGYSGVPSFFSIAALEDIETDEPVGVTSLAGSTASRACSGGAAWASSSRRATRAWVRTSRSSSSSRRP